MNECEAVRDLLALRPDEWSAGERRQAEAHLETCPHCVAFFQAYAEQDLLIRAAPRVRLTPSQRAQLLSRTQREERRHKMHTRLSTVLGTATVFATLAALTLGLYLLFQGQDQPTVGAPAPTVEPLTTPDPSVVGPTPTLEPLITPSPTAVEPLATPEPPVFAGEIRIARLTLEPSTGEPISFTLGESDSADPLVLGKLYIPAEVHLALDWEVVALPSADWVVFVHLLNEAGQLVMQSDLAIDWPEQPCSEDESLGCTVTSEHEWVFPADFTPGLYSIVAGLYDSVTNPVGTTPPQVLLGQVQVLADEPVSEHTHVTLFIFSGRPNPTWSLTQAQDVELGQRLNAFPPADQPFEEFKRLGYAGFSLLLPAIENQPRQHVEVFEGIARVDTDDLVTFLADENRALEWWLLDTATGYVEDEVIEMARKELETPSTPAATITPAPTPTPDPVAVEGFAIYLTIQERSAALLAGADLDSLEIEKQPIISSDDILRYSRATHEIDLTASASQRINQLFVPVDGRGFVVSIGAERIYSGAFWTLASSLSFDGIVIQVPLLDESMRIQLGYPESLDLFQGEDLRSDSRILESLEQAGKLE